jgi:Na+/melibiose symporter-like transporter
VAAGLSLNALAAGVAAIPFLEITSKTVPVTERGSFFAGRRVVGGILGVGAGLLIAAVLKGDPGALWAQTPVYRAVKSAVDAIGWSGRDFPYDYGLLIVIGGVISTAGVVAYLFVQEPPAEHIAHPAPIRKHLAEGLAMLKAMPDYRRYLGMRVFYQLTSMAFPFYATYAYVRLGYSQASVGVFVSIWVGAGVISNLVWGRLLDRKGNRAVFLSTAAMSVLAPLSMLVIAARGGEHASSPAVFGAVAATFVFNGAVRSGRFIANQTYLLESAPARRRPLYVGFMNSLSFPFMLSPILGGVIVAALGYQTLFVIGALASVADFAASARLREPRVRLPAVADEPISV